MSFTIVFPFALRQVQAGESIGLERLCGEGTPLRQGDRISFVGDSITMQGGYIDLLAKALKDGTSTTNLGVQLFKHGLNGGRTDTILTGVTPWGKQDAYADLLSKDKPTAVVLFLGVNDVNQGNAVGPEAFEKNLNGLVDTARKTGAVVVLATPAVSGEKHDGTNPADRKMDQYAAISRKVAMATHATLCDVRKAFIEYLKANNPENKAKGLLTYDGIHMSPKGNELLAEYLATALADALAKRAPGDAKAVRAAGPSGPLLIPRPASVKVDQGVLVFTRGSRIVATEPALAPLARVLSDEIFAVTNIRLAPSEGQAKAGDVTLQIDTSLKNEAYRIEVNGSAVLKGGNYPAVASATVTLLQALQSADGGLALPKMTITDQPTYSYRAAMIDLARKYHTCGGIEQVIELCRLYKIRYLHLHLTDDHLFMFPSTQFPQAGRSNQEFARFEPASKPRIEPYTLEELKHLEQFASDRGVYLVPELDLPGHSGRLVSDVRETFSFPGNGSTVNIANPKTLAAVATLLNEVMDVFQSTPYIHLGADEVGLGALEKTPEYREAQTRLGNIKSPHDLYCRFITDLYGIVAKRGKKAIVWEEAWNAGGAYPLPKDVLVMVWNQGRNPNAIVKSGYAVVNATWTPLYIVRDNKKSLAFLQAWDVTKFGREGSEQYTTLDDTAKLMGAQLCSWESEENIEIQSMRDRLALVAERTWNPKVGGDLTEFRERLAHTDGILDRLVHPIEIQVQGEFARDENTFTEPITITLTPRQKGLTLRYTLDNSLPNASWKTYTGPIVVEQTVHLRAGLFDAKNEQQGYLVGSWFRRIVAVKPNLATGKPVTVGPGPDRNDNWSSKVAVDGRADNVNAHWASIDPSPQWLQIDLEKVCPVDYINVITYYDGGRYYQLNAEVSVDGKTWRKVLDFSDNKIPATAAGHFGNFPKTDARYVRINMLKNSANAWVHIVEVIVNEAK